MSGITFVGAGALAQALAAHLAPVVPVTLVPSMRTAAELRRRGSIVTAGLSEKSAQLVEGQATAPGAIGLLDSVAAVCPDDGVIFSTKGPQLVEVMGQLDPLGRTSFVAGLQNGVLKDDALRSHFGHEAVIGAVTLFNARREGDTVVVGGTGSAYFGEFDGSLSARVEELVGWFEQADLQAAASGDIMSLTWMKCVNAMGIFGVSTLTRHTSSLIMQTPELVSAYLDVLAEASAVAVAEGATIGDYRDIPMASYLLRPKAIVLDEIVRAARANAAGPGSLSSMAQDVIAGRATESEQTFGDLVERADRHGVPVPRLEFIRELLAGSDRLIREGG